jgi:hypothetical protein
MHNAITGMAVRVVGTDVIAKHPIRGSVNVAVTCRNDVLLEDYATPHQRQVLLYVTV